MRRITLKEFVREWRKDLEGRPVPLNSVRLVKMLDETGERFLVRARFEEMLKELRRSYIDDVPALLYRDDVIKLNAKDWERAKKKFLYFEIEHRWTNDHMDCDWYIVSPLKLTKPRG